jgi:hypothetical protein
MRKGTGSGGDGRRNEISGGLGKLKERMRKSNDGEVDEIFIYSLVCT